MFALQLFKNSLNPFRTTHPKGKTCKNQVTCKEKCNYLK